MESIKRSKIRNNREKFDEINIIPFIDIMLVLLAIVLITASFISQGKIQVNVPKPVQRSHSNQMN